MNDARERWSQLSRPWKTFWVALVILVIFFIARGVPQLIPLAVLWAAGAATLVRVRDHFMPGDDDPPDRW